MKVSFALILTFLICQFTVAQVGIGTTDPAVGTVLHVDDGSGTKGVKLPDADIVDLNTIAPLPVGTEEGTMVYNTNAFTGRGHFYWNGFVWAPIQLFADRSAKFDHAGPIETVAAVNLNQAGAGVDVELMDNTVFDETSTLYTPIADANGRFTNLEVDDDGRYRITVFVGLEKDNVSGGASIQGRLKITDSSNVVRYDGSYHRSSELDRTGDPGGGIDDDGTLYFTEIIELNAGDKVAVNCTRVEGTTAVYQRDPNLSAIIIEKLR
ncbi:putative phage tail protein [Nonlabens dokdonensis DSW-6]|uniref:Putative phage tail protein n=1 Tax=Nonlabens dokdonensis (strain DSM 17205 / KCTC 12402 / DSW-6) TaxID=592029 RepID=L7WBR2_NONDD|nr:putative phage tail protein [Nonlabens dokdonensis DSW-6]